MNELENKKQKEYKGGWLEKIQSLDHHTKTKLLIILSVLAIGFIIFIWGAYFNFMLAQLSKSESGFEKNQNTQDTQVDFMNKIKTGTAFILDSGISFFKYLVGILDVQKEYIVK